MRLKFFSRYAKRGLSRGEGGFTLVLALVVLSVLFAAAAGLALSRQFWGFSATKQLDRVMMDASVGADMSVWLSVFRGQVQSAASSSSRELNFGDPAVRNKARASITGLPFPSKSLSWVTGFNVPSNSLFQAVVPYPEFPQGVDGWAPWKVPTYYFPAVVPRISGFNYPDMGASDPILMPFSMGSRDPYYGVYSPVYGLDLLFRREMDDAGASSTRQGRYQDLNTRMKAWYSIDGAGHLSTGFRYMSLSQFTLFVPHPRVENARTLEPVRLTYFGSNGFDPSNFGEPFTVGANTFERPGAIFEVSGGNNYSLTYTSATQNPATGGGYAVYSASNMGIGRVYIEGYASVVTPPFDPLVPNGPRWPLPLGFPLVVTGEGTYDGAAYGYGGFYDNSGNPFAGQPVFTSFIGGNRTFSFPTFGDYVKDAGPVGGFSVMSSSLAPSRLLRTFARKVSGSRVYSNVPLVGNGTTGYLSRNLSSFDPQVGLGRPGGNGVLALSWNATGSSGNGTWEVSSEYSRAALDQVEAAWTINATGKTLTFKPPMSYHKQVSLSNNSTVGWPSSLGPPLVVYLDDSWASANFTVTLDLSSLNAGIKDLGDSGQTRLTILSASPVHLQGANANFEAARRDDVFMIVAPRIIVPTQITQLHGIFITEGRSALHAIEAPDASRQALTIQGGLILWDRSDKPLSSNSNSFRPVILKPSADYIMGDKMPYWTRDLVDPTKWLGPPAVVDIRPEREGLELYKIRAATEAGVYRQYKEENRRD